MVVIREGRIEHGSVVLPVAVDLPDGTAVRVMIEVMPVDGERSADESVDFSTAPFFGSWADRDDLADSAAWVSRQRDAWQQRTTRAD